MDGNTLLEYIQEHYGNPRQLAIQIAGSENLDDYRKYYLFLNRATTKAQLSYADKKRLKDEFGIPISEISRNYTEISGNLVANNHSNITQGENTDLRIENAVLKEKIKGLEEQIELLKKMHMNK